MSLFGTDGIRSRAGEGPLAPDRVRILGQAIGRLLRTEPRIFHPDVSPGIRRSLNIPVVSGRRVVIGRDTRKSGPGIEKDLLSKMGVDAIRVGVVPTPGVAWLARKWKAALGIVISASHNPAHDNGIKLISGEGFKIPDTAEARIESALAEAGGLPAPRGKSTRRPATEYLEFLRSQLPDGKPLKGFKIVVDCGHGATSAFAGRLFRSTGADAIVLHDAPNGLNINKDSGALHPERLGAAVRMAKARLGVAYDGDADRCILVDEHGTVRDGDFVLAICADSMKKHGTLGGTTVVSTVMANFGLEKYLGERGLSLRRVKVGDKFVAEEMMRSGARLGGEQSGHIIFLDAATAGDGMLTTLRVLAILLETGVPLSRLCEGLVKVPQVLINIMVNSKPDLESVDSVRRAMRESEADIRGEGRVLVRYSGTETMCRVMVEGTRASRVQAAADRIAASIRKEIGA